jgi:hypothetical protein
MSAWKTMAESLAHKHWVNAGLTEEEADEAEPKQEGWCTQSKYEITTRAEGNKLPRDKRALNQRRSVILTTPNAVEARAKEARDAADQEKAKLAQKTAKAEAAAATKLQTATEKEEKQARTEAAAAEKNEEGTYAAQLQHARWV